MKTARRKGEKKPGAVREFLDGSKRTLLLGLPGVLLAAFVTWYMLFRGPGAAVGHREFVKADTAVIVVVCPPHVQSYVSGLVPAATRFVPGIPKITSMQPRAIDFDWIHKMPREMAFLFDQRSPEYHGVTLFFREHPTSESLERLVDAGFFYSLRPLEWPGVRLARQGIGKLAAEGRLSIPPYAQIATEKQFPNYAPLDPPRVSGNHFVEIAINNRNGALTEMLGAFSGLVAPWADSALRERLMSLSGQVAEGSFTADLAGDDELKCVLVLDCGNAAAAGNVEGAAAMAADAVARFLSAAHGFSLEGRVERRGAEVRAEHTLSGFEGRLRRALGG